MGSSPRHPAFDHQALFHRGDDELVGQLVPRVQDALADGAAVMVCTDERAWSLLAAGLDGDADAVRFVPANTRYAKPNDALRLLNEFAVQAVSNGSTAAWSIGAIPYDGVNDEDWHRYEAAVDAVLAHLPIHAVCTYDLDRTERRTLEVASQTHRHPLHGHGSVAAPAGAPMTLTGGLPVHTPTIAPVVAATVESPPAARDTLVAALSDVVPAEPLAHIELATSELVTNSFRHGTPPVTLTVWYDAPRVVVDVHDVGPGVDDPFFDLRPPRPERSGGVGLWIVGQVSDRVRVRRHDDWTASVVFERTVD